MMQKKANDAQIKLMNSQAEQMDAETQLTKKDLGTYDKRFEFVKQAAEDSSKKIMSEIEVNQQSIIESAGRVALLAAQEKITLEQAATEVVNRAFLQESFQDRLEQIRLQNKLTKQEIRKAVETVKLLAQQILVAKAQESNIKEDTNLKKAQASSIAFNDNLDASKFQVILEKEYGGFFALMEDGSLGKVDKNGSTIFRGTSAVGAILSSLLPLLSVIKIGGK